jgi:hypothetical protein
MLLSGVKGSDMTVRKYTESKHSRWRTCIILIILLSVSRTLLVAERPEPQNILVPHWESKSLDVISYWYGSSYRTPFVIDPQTGKAASIRRDSIEYMHAGRSGMLSSFADVFVSQSDMAEPAAKGGTGATELYTIFRPAVSLNALTHSTVFHVGPLRDVAFDTGANLETKNSSFAPGERTIYIGPKLEFAVPRGFVNVGLHLRKEWNHEGVLGKSENYDPDFNFEPAWMIPFAIGRFHFSCAGFADYNTPKGKDSFGSQTVGEFLLRTTLAVDAGALLFGRAQMLELSGGFWYWQNEYGKAASNPGAQQMTPLVGMTFHLDGGHSIHR